MITLFDYEDYENEISMRVKDHDPDLDPDLDLDLIQLRRVLRYSSGGVPDVIKIKINKK